MARGYRSLPVCRRVSEYPAAGRTVSLVTLGCARNEVDSEELAARLEAGGLAAGPTTPSADVVLVNTCGFIQAAKQESIDELLAPDPGGAKVVAAGCLAERYGSELAEALPEAQVLSFDDYGDIAARLDAVLAGQRWPAHAARDRRRLLPITPAGRPAPRRRASRARARRRVLPDLPARAWRRRRGPASPRVLRRRLGGGPVAPLKIASGCDRRCSFCAIPSFRGAFVSRPAARPDRRGRLAGRARASASCSWSARTPPPTARTWATCGCWRRCCPSWPRCRASSGSGSATCSPPRCGRG